MLAKDHPEMREAKNDLSMFFTEHAEIFGSVIDLLLDLATDDQHKDLIAKIMNPDKGFSKKDRRDEFEQIASKLMSSDPVTQSIFNDFVSSSRKGNIAAWGLGIAGNLDAMSLTDSDLSFYAGIEYLKVLAHKNGNQMIPSQTRCRDWIALSNLFSADVSADIGVSIWWDTPKTSDTYHGFQFRLQIPYPFTKSNLIHGAVGIELRVDILGWTIPELGEDEITALQSEAADAAQAGDLKRSWDILSLIFDVIHGVRIAVGYDADLTHAISYLSKPFFEWARGFNAEGKAGAAIFMKFLGSIIYSARLVPLDGFFYQQEQTVSKTKWSGSDCTWVPNYAVDDGSVASFTITVTPVVFGTEAAKEFRLAHTNSQGKSVGATTIKLAVPSWMSQCVLPGTLNNSTAPAAAILTLTSSGNSNFPPYNTVTVNNCSGLPSNPFFYDQDASSVNVIVLEFVGRDQTAWTNDITFTLENVSPNVQAAPPVYAPAQFKMSGLDAATSDQVGANPLTWDANWMGLLNDELSATATLTLTFDYQKNVQQTASDPAYVPLVIAWYYPDGNTEGNDDVIDYVSFSNDDWTDTSDINAFTLDLDVTMSNTVDPDNQYKNDNYYCIYNENLPNSAGNIPVLAVMQIQEVDGVATINNIEYIGYIYQQANPFDFAQVAAAFWQGTTFSPKPQLGTYVQPDANNDIETDVAFDSSSPYYGANSLVLEFSEIKPIT